MIKLPLFFENSRVPSIVSKFSPIEAYAVAFFIFIWCKGEISGSLRRHELIHWKQQLELLFVFQWILYISFWLVLWVYHKDRVKAYRLNPFELESYENQSDKLYLKMRRTFAWRHYIKSSFER